MKREASRTRLFCGFAVGFLFGVACLQGCTTHASSSQARARTSTSKPYLLEYSARIRKHLEKLDELHERQSSALVLTPETRDSSRQSLRSFLDSLAEYQRLLDELGATLDDADVAEVRAALTRSEQVQARLEEEALHLTRIARGVDGEIDAAAAGPAPDPASRLAPSREYRQVVWRAVALAASVNNYLTTLHQKNLVPHSRAAHPAEGVFHFLRLCALEDPRLETHAPYFDRAWRLWIHSRSKEGRFAKAIAVFHLVMEMGGRFHPDSLEPLSETVHESLASPPEPGVVEAMETSLKAVESTMQSLRAAPPDWEAEFQRIRGAFTLLRATVADPETRLTLAREARKLDPRLDKRVRTLIVNTAETIGNLYLDLEQYEGAIAAFRRALEIGTVPDRTRLINHYRALVFERGLKDARKVTGEERFGSARDILEQLGRVAASPSEKSKAKEALHSYYEVCVNRALERDPSTAIAIVEEMIRVFPSDTAAKRRMDDVLFGLLKKSIGDLKTSRQRLGASGVLERFRTTVARMVTNEGTAACQRLLNEIEDTWSRALNNARTGEEAFSIAFDIGRLKGESPPAARSSGARALAERFERAAVRRDWGQIEDCINTHLSLCPSEARPSNYREVYLEFLAHLNEKGRVHKLGRHLSIFATTFPDDVRRVQDIIVERMRSTPQQSAIFYALLRTFAPESDEVRVFKKEHHAEDVGLEETLGYLISSEDLAAARVQSQRSRAAAGSSGEPDDVTHSVSPPRIEALAERADTDPPRPVPDRGPVPESAPEERGEVDSHAAVLISGAGCSLLVVLLTLLTRSRGILAFRWYALAALWWGVTVGLVLGSPSIRAKLTRGAEAPQGATGGSSATVSVSTGASPSVEVRVASPSPRGRSLHRKSFRSERGARSLHLSGKP